MLIVDLQNIRNYAEGVLISVINLHNSLVDIEEGGLNCKSHIVNVFIIFIVFVIISYYGVCC